IRFIVNLQNKKEKTSQIDTLNYILAKPSGEWLGTGFGETKETLFQYKLNYKFPKEGTYEVDVQHAMRNDILTGIEDIGIKVETAKP
ncbi:MAG: gliding motility lipoprotein GldH, partial [Chryseobacterium sp.]|nr:gliding motility lipoprotein GldH [Candidatus Chryseobacterium enterohippi]